MKELLDVMNQQKEREESESNKTILLQDQITRLSIKCDELRNDLVEVRVHGHSCHESLNFAY